MKKVFIIPMLLIVTCSFGKKKKEIWGAIQSVYQVDTSDLRLPGAEYIKLEKKVRFFYKPRRFRSKKKLIALEQYLVLSKYLESLKAESLILGFNDSLISTAGSTVFYSNIDGIGTNSILEKNSNVLFNLRDNQKITFEEYKKREIQLAEEARRKSLLLAKKELSLKYAELKMMFARFNN